MARIDRYRRDLGSEYIDILPIHVVAHTRKIHAQGTGIIGMKLTGEGRFTKIERVDRSLNA